MQRSRGGISFLDFAGEPVQNLGKIFSAELNPVDGLPCRGVVLAVQVADQAGMSLVLGVETLVQTVFLAIMLILGCLWNLKSCIRSDDRRMHDDLTCFALWLRLAILIAEEDFPHGTCFLKPSNW